MESRVHGGPRRPFRGTGCQSARTAPGSRREMRQGQPPEEAIRRVRRRRVKTFIVQSESTARSWVKQVISVTQALSRAWMMRPPRAITCKTRCSGRERFNGTIPVSDDSGGPRVQRGQAMCVPRAFGPGTAVAGSLASCLHRVTDVSVMVDRLGRRAAGHRLARCAGSACCRMCRRFSASFP